MPAEQYHEPPEELSQETRTFARMIKSLIEEADAPGEILLANSTTDSVRNELKKMDYNMSFGNRTSGPINAIYFDRKHGSLWGGSSNNGEDYGIGW